MLGAGVVLAAVTFVYVVAVVMAGQRSAAARTPHGIMSRLRQPGDRVTVSATGIAGGRGVWNPGKPPGRGNLIVQPGVAIYTLGTDGLVHLDWRSRTGHQTYFGPPLPAVEHVSTNRPMLWTVLIGGVGGLAIGYLFSVIGEVGQHPDQRVLVGLAGLGVALAALGGAEVVHVRRHRRAHPT